MVSWTHAQELLQVNAASVERAVDVVDRVLNGVVVRDEVDQPVASANFFDMLAAILGYEGALGLQKKQDKKSFRRVKTQCGEILPRKNIEGLTGYGQWRWRIRVHRLRIALAT